MKLEAPSGFGSGRVDTGPGSYLENPKFAGMLDLQVQKGRWFLLADIIYVSFSDDNQRAHLPGTSPGSGGWTAQADTELQALVFELAGAYTVLRNEYLNFDLLAGVRYAEIDGKASLDIIGPLPDWVRSRTFSKTESFADPIVGFKGKFELDKKWYLPYCFDKGMHCLSADSISTCNPGLIMFLIWRLANESGIQKYGYALLLMTDSAMKWIDKSDGWEIGAGPSIVVVDTGAAKSMTTTTLQTLIYAFFFDQKGLMGSLDMQGTKIIKIEK